LIAALLAATSANSADPIRQAVQARQSQMALFTFNIGLLGAMAKGAIPYDRDTAKGAAGNLVRLSAIDGTAMWVGNSDNESIENTRAKPHIWTDLADLAANSET